MSRMTQLVLLVCALACSMAHASDMDSRFVNRLTVQKALDDAQDHLKRGNFRDAVQLLEKHIAHIEGNRAYLVALRDAYAGHVAQLKAGGNLVEAARYADRLSILQPPTDPGSQGERGVSTPRSDEQARPLPLPVPDRATPVPATLAQGPRMIALGKLEEKSPLDDPFSPTNRSGTSAASLVERGDRAFAAKDYETAARLFEEAEQRQAGCTAASCERWAYCKLFRVARAINGDGIPAGEDLEREIGEALRLSPKMEAFAGQLRASLREAIAGITVRHTPRLGNGWALTETANFRIFHATTEAVAEKAARLAEATRTAMARKWTGSVPPDWAPRCDVYLHPTIKGYTIAGGREGSPGHSSISLSEGKVSVRRVDLRLDDPNLFAATLQHETTHVVLAGHFGRHHVPRWSDEGIAVVSEGHERTVLHLRNLPTYRREGKLFRIETLLKLEDYPDAERIGPFYAQSVSLVQFLVRRKDAATLVGFIRDGLENGYERAIKTHYGIETFAELEQEWLQHVFGESVAKAGLTR